MVYLPRSVMEPGFQDEARPPVVSVLKFENSSRWSHAPLGP